MSLPLRDTTLTPLPLRDITLNVTASLPCLSKQVTINVTREVEDILCDASVPWECTVLFLFLRHALYLLSLPSQQLFFLPFAPLALGLLPSLLLLDGSLAVMLYIGESYSVSMNIPGVL